MKILESLKNMLPSTPVVDPSRFDDPLAMQTEWKPLKSGGTNFQTHRLVIESGDRVAFKPSLGAYLFAGIFTVVGIGVSVIFLTAQPNQPEEVSPFLKIIPVFIGLFFASFGFLMIRAVVKPIVFDRRKRYYWKGKHAPDEVFDQKEVKEFAAFDDIHAVQLLSEYVSGQKSSYYSYEMNLVLKDGTRLNVIDHGSRTRIQRDAAKIAAFIGCPLWDGAG